VAVFVRPGAVFAFDVRFAVGYCAELGIEGGHVPVTVIDSDRATLWYHPETGIVHHYFRIAAHGADFRGVLEAGLQIMREHGATKWLSDDRNNNALTPEDSDWAINVWSHAAVKAGWRYWAIVLPEYVVGKMDMAQYIALYRTMGVSVRVFSDPDEALEWLTSVDLSPNTVEVEASS
jgi:hypothetical protein